MVPHAVLDFYTRESFLRLGVALSGAHARAQLSRLWHGVDAGSIPLKEVNGELERFAGLLLAYLNEYAHVCERPRAKRQVFVSKVRGFTFGGAWHSPTGRAPAAEVCEAPLEAPPCFYAERDGCAEGKAWPPNVTRPVGHLRRRG